MTDFIFQPICRMCGGSEFEIALSLNPLPIGDRYVPKDDEEQQEEVNQTYPMDIQLCKSCGHLQNTGYVNPELIYKHYLSRPSAINPTLSGDYKEYANDLINNFTSNDNPLLVEAGSNDGAFLKHFGDRGYRAVGVEPSPNLCEAANKINSLTMQGYFTESLSNQLEAEFGKANYFVANHMFANVNDSEDFLRGVKNILSPSGVFVMQTFYQIDVLEQNLIENFTHEHLSYFNIRPYRDFLKRNGMELFDVKRIPAKGGSIRCFAQHEGGKRPKRHFVDYCVDLEEGRKMFEAKTYEKTLNYIGQTSFKFHNLLSPKQTIAGYGTSTGATTFVFQFELNDLIDFFVDDDPYRHNLVSPVDHIPVLPVQEIYERKPDYVIILAPLYSEQIINKNKEYLKQGGKFIVFWPEFKVIGE